MSIEQDRTSLSHKEADLAAVNKKVANEQVRLSKAAKKATNAEKAASRTKSDSTRRNELREYQRATDKVTRRQKTVASLQAKAATIEKTVDQLRNKIAREVKQEGRKQEQAAKNAQREPDRELNGRNRSLRGSEAQGRCAGEGDGADHRPLPGGVAQAGLPFAHRRKDQSDTRRPARVRSARRGASGNPLGC